jgi:TonB family protein
VAIHNRLHGRFADGVLPSFDDLHKVDPTQYTTVELTLTPDAGRLAGVTILRPSGSAEFDAAVLSVVRQAEPYGAAPTALVSGDGLVHVSWEFHRNHFDACATRGANVVMQGSRGASSP